MRLQYICTSCKKGNYFTPQAPTRGDLQMKIGDKAKVNCKNCGKIEKKHLNEIFAIVDNRMIFAALGLGFITTSILWWLYGSIAVLSFSIPLLVWVQENKARSSFNTYRIRKK